MFNFALLFGAILFITLDFVYLHAISGHFQWQINKVQQSPLKVRYLGAALCYVFLIAGLHYFILKPKRPVSDAFLLGLVIYGVYETTNYALLKDWALSTVIIDTLWGGVLFALTTFAVQLLRL